MKRLLLVIFLLCNKAVAQGYDNGITIIPAHHIDYAYGSTLSLQTVLANNSWYVKHQIYKSDGWDDEQVSIGYSDHRLKIDFSDSAIELSVKVNFKF